MTSLRPMTFGVWLTLAVAIPAHALDPTKQITQYGHTTWKAKDGLLSGMPLTIAQTADGYMWIGTRSGLLRFDGVRFVRMPQEGDARTLGITALLATRDGSLWIGSEGGVSRWKDGRLTNVASPRGPVEAMAETPDGTLWFVRSRSEPDAGPLCRIAGDTVRCFGADDGVPETLLTAIVLDRSGDLWLGGTRTLLHGRPGRFRTYSPTRLMKNSNMAGVAAIALGADDNVWVGMSTGGGVGLQRLVRDKWASVTAAFDSSTLPVTALFFDSEGALWIGTYQGIYRLQNDRVQRFGRADGLSGDFVIRFFEDRERTLWVITNEGLDQFRDLRVTSYSRREGLGSPEIDGVHTSRDGTVWIGGAGALDALRDGKVRSFTTDHGLPGDQVTAMLEDRDGRLWVGIDGMLTRYDNGRFTRVDYPDGRQVSMVLSMTEDIHGNLWAAVAGPPRAVLRIRDGVVRESFTASMMPDARRVAAAPDGSVWLGLVNGDLARWRDGTVEVVPFRPNPVPRFTTLINQLAVQPDGAVLGATGFGLVGWKDGTRRTLTVDNGLPCDQLFALVDDAEGNLWLSAECGLIEISASQLHDWWADGAVHLRPTLLDAFDGAQAAWTPFQGAARSRDGRLWFANNILLQVLDPARLHDGGLAPPVHIEEVVADRARLAAQPGLRLPPLTRDLQITYTAPSFVVPQKVQFRYKLEGHDASWVEAGSRRVAFYNDLPPGNYRFHVIASNHNGVWNESGAEIHFGVGAAWYQTTWFRLASIVLGVGAFAAIYRIRVRRLAASLAERFDERLMERTRLARDLHDSLLQTIQASKLLVDGKLLESDNPDQMRLAANQVSVWLDQAVREGRAALHSLRSHHRGPSDLPNVLQQLAAEVDLDRSMTTSVSIAGTPRELHPVVTDEVASIGHEAMRNACLHSGGTRLDVDLVYDANLTLRIRDNGTGIDSSVVTDGKDGHFGILGMRERATALGGTLKVASANAMGTDVTLVVPGSVAFGRPRGMTPPRHESGDAVR